MSLSSDFSPQVQPETNLPSPVKLAAFGGGAFVVVFAAAMAATGLMITGGFGPGKDSPAPAARTAAPWESFAYADVNQPREARPLRTGPTTSVFIPRQRAGASLVEVRHTAASDQTYSPAPDLDGAPPEPAPAPDMRIEDAPSAPAPAALHFDEF